jgi:hypothetical protein
MKTRNLIPVFLVFSWILWMAPVGCVHPPAQGTHGAVPSLTGSKVTIKGEIVYMRSGYFLNGVDPSGRFIIENENPQVLEELAKRGEAVTVEGRLTHGADYLFIEKINGQPYIGKK